MEKAKQKRLNYPLELSPAQGHFALYKHESLLLLYKSIFASFVYRVIMQQYSRYQHSLDMLLTETCWGRKPMSQSDLQPHLNGGAAASLRDLVSRSQIRRSGAFFTGEDLGRQLVEAASIDRMDETPAWDPTCGAGDLLLRWSERL
ncbi:MAG: hypothetical protein ACOYOU_15720, partial [Kiritimatiellia bacterium]